MEIFEEPIATLIADGAYDRFSCYEAIQKKGGRGREEWKKQTGYHRRRLEETAMSRLKRMLGKELIRPSFRKSGTGGQDLVLHPESHDAARHAGNSCCLVIFFF